MAAKEKASPSGPPLPLVLPPRVLLAVSGGPDSMALLDAAAKAASPLKNFVVVGHVNHGLRGRASEADAAFVRRAAGARGFPVRVARVPTAFYARRSGLGLEEAARDLRYRALARMAGAWRCGVVMTAHTLDDQAETVLMNLIRGSGPAGLGGMAPSSPWPVPEKGEVMPRLERPFLNVRRAALTSYLRAHRVAFRVDATNAQPLFFRNRVRPVVRAWERERPGLAERLGRLAEILRDEEAFWETHPALFRRKTGGKGLDLGPFKRYHKAVQRRLLRREFGFSSFSTVERARVFALEPVPAGQDRRLSVPGGWMVKRGGRLRFMKLPVPGKRIDKRKKQ